MKQASMLRMVYCLIPVALSGVYFFGWRAAAVVGVCLVAALVTERITSRARGQAISTACLVTALLYTLSLPPTVPLWIAVVGIVVGVLFGKEVFGGFGRNFANPAIVGRAFVYICFPVELTGRFVPVFKGFPGGLAHWSFEGLGEMPTYLAASAGKVADAVSQASPIWVARQYGLEAVANTGRGASIWDMALGSIGGTFQAGGESARRVLTSGCIGEGCAALIALTAVYLLWTKTAKWRLMIGGFTGLVIANMLFRNILGFDGIGQIPPIEWQLLSGTTMFAVVYMITEPVSAPKKNSAQIAYAFLIGFLIVVLRWRSMFVAAATFAILLGNLVAPLFDAGVEAWERRGTQQ
jgi:Na+-transporting NADH:ubiquinone oxidoreductase subunit B